MEYRTDDRLESGGNAAKNLWKAATPPVDAPTTILSRLVLVRVKNPALPGGVSKGDFS